MPWYSIITLEEFPAPIEDMLDVQYCAVTRVLRAAQIMRDIAIYRGEKVGGRFTEAVHIVGGISKANIDDVRQRAQERADNAHLSRYLAPVIVESLDPQSTPSVATLDLKALPEGFDLDAELRWYIAFLATGFGRDYQDFAPLPGRGLGTSQQSETLHLKSRGKGPQTWDDVFTTAMNNFVMPRDPGDLDDLLVTFSYTDQDIQAEQQAADVQKTRAEARQIRIDSGEITPEIARQIAQDEGDLSEELLQAVEAMTPISSLVTEEGERTGTITDTTVEDTEEKEGSPRFPFWMWRAG
jgi:hypothetical protein